MRIDWRATPPTGARPKPSGADGAVEGEARLRLAGELRAGVVLRQKFHIAGLGTAVRGLVLNAEVRQFQVAVHHGQAVCRAEGPYVGVPGPVGGPITAVEKRL